MVPPRNPRKIAEAVEKVIYNKELIKKYSKNSRKLFEENFTKEKHYKKLVKIYSN